MKKRNLKYKSAFDIIGPIMIGPSSSHTAGAVRIGKTAGELLQDQVEKLIVTFYGSFAETYKGHGTAVAIVAGILGYEPSDERIPQALVLAEKNGMTIEFLTSQKKMPHANTVNLELIGQVNQLNLTGVSIGGGNIQITELNHCSMDLLDDRLNPLAILSNDKEVIQSLKEELRDFHVVTTQQSRESTLFIIETMQEITQRILKRIRNIPGIAAAVPIRG
ncbi:L-serine ammonia-lyase, iron-sulfur-dependent subunit beta [Enterococcus sp. AZ072]|uniref:L-serine ammonia-lyase, iron-sulfur-dependent subunit beta n=1 Tax=unclassified Enterococcus TaxID=2608891 RepID=UPI003D297528